ncbi:MAG: GGDEF domain-containing protein [Bacillota bacterium]|nr:GGDEF domain-containing protein [Bacillota bacterium]
MAKNDKRLTIGVLVSGIMDDFTVSICRGVMQSAKAANVNTVVFSGKYLDRDLSQNSELMYEYQFNTMFSYAKKDNLDALLIAADCIGCFTTKERMEEMIRQYEGIPCVLVASKMDGYVSVTYDNYSGIREGMEYLIHKLNCSKFGMIGGPESNTDARERKNAFLSVLKENGLEADARLYVEGDLSRRAGEKFKELLDRDPEIEAVFCVNDDTALGLYDELKRRNLMPGKDISILGYDDTILAAKSNPSLSSVRADPVELGVKAFKLVLRMVQGEQVESEILPTRFVKRDSFFDESMGEESGGRLHDIGDIDTYFDDIFYRYKHEDMEAQMRYLRLAFTRFMKKLLLLFEGEDHDFQLYMDIQALTDDFLNHGAMEYADMDNLMITLEKIYHMLKRGQPGIERKYELRDLFANIYRKIIRAMDNQFGTMREIEERTNYSMKLFIRDMLQFEKGNDQSYASVLGNLEWMDIRNAFVYVFKNPVIHLYKESFQAPEYLYLKAALRNGVVQAVPSIQQKKSLNDIFDSRVLAVKDQYSMVMLPLFSGEMLYGVILCDLTDKIFENGEFMINQMSSAIKMISLLKANEEIQQKLEESLATLKENNIVLDNLSRSDGLTGILNRRGFYTAAQELMESGRKEGKRILVIYVDMNNLKIINDRYGHEEGDFSLKLIGEIISEAVRESGIAGRIGGDEFACILEYSGEDEGEAILSDIYGRFEAFNADSPKPYNVTVSAGACVLKNNENLTLKEALTQADEKLYEVKKVRSKEVAKRV